MRMIPIVRLELNEQLSLKSGTKRGLQRGIEPCENQQISKQQLYIYFSISDDNSEKQNGENYVDDEEGVDGDGEAGDYDSSDFDDDEIENLLDEKLPDDLRESKRPKYEQRFKTVLEGDFLVYHTFIESI